MKKIYTIIFLVCSIQFVYSQSGWFWQNPLPQGNEIFEYKFLDMNTGIVINYDNILKTTNCGESWQLIYTGINTSNGSISIVNSNLGYILLDSSILLRTDNGGLNWAFVNKINGFSRAHLYFQNSNTGFLFGSNGKLLGTTNKGLDWTELVNDANSVFDFICFPNLLTGYVAGSYRNSNGSVVKIYKTTDGGISWFILPNNLKTYVGSFLFTDENTGYLCGQTDYPGEGVIFKTTDGGVTWNAMARKFGEAIIDLYFIDRNTGFLIPDYTDLYKTTNGGVDWEEIPIYQVCGNNVVHKLYFLNYQTGFCFGSGGMILKTTNGGFNWVKKTGGADSYLEDIRFADVNTGFVSGDNGTLMRTTNGGVNWCSIIVNNAIFDNDLGVISNIGISTWFVTQWMEGKIYKTTNTGLTWDTLYTNLYGITRLKFINANTGFGICKYNAFFKTTNGGTNWIIYPVLGSQNWGMDFVDENTGFVGTGSKTLKTEDGGMTWDTIPLPHFLASDIQFVNLNTGYISGYNAVLDDYQSFIYKTTNCGLDWNYYQVSNEPLWDIYFVNEQTGFTLDWGRIFKTSNGGVNWNIIKTCNYISPTISYFVNPLTGWIIGDKGTIIKTTTGGESPVLPPLPLIIPIKFVLYQNYPNPFNPITHIKFDLPEAANVKLTIYDIIGRRVAVIVDAQLQPDYYEYSWDGRNFASGVYFYQLKAGGFIQSKKMVLVK